MDGGLDEARARLKTDRESNVLHLTTGCPFDRKNPLFCPLRQVRKLPLNERIKWVRLLNDEDLEYFSAYHEICLHWRFCSAEAISKHAKQAKEHPVKQLPELVPQSPTATA